MVLNTKLSSVSHPSPLSASSLLFFLFSPFSSLLVSPLPSHFSKLSCHACSISFLFCLILFLQSSFCTQLLTLIYILFFSFLFFLSTSPLASSPSNHHPFSPSTSRQSADPELCVLSCPCRTGTIQQTQMDYPCSTRD